MRRLPAFILLTICILPLSGCASSDVIPEALEPQIDKNLTFDQVIASPDSYRGRTFVVGGEVLKSKRLKEGTQIEVLQHHSMTISGRLASGPNPRGASWRWTLSLRIRRLSRRHAGNDGSRSHRGHNRPAR